MKPIALSLVALFTLCLTQGCGGLGSPHKWNATRSSISETRWTSALVANHVARCVFRDDGSGILAFANSIDPHFEVLKYGFRWKFQDPNGIEIKIVEQAQSLQINTVGAVYWGAELDLDVRFNGYTGLRRLEMVREAEFMERFHRMDKCLENE